MDIDERPFQFRALLDPANNLRRPVVFYDGSVARSLSNHSGCAGGDLWTGDLSLYPVRPRFRD